MILPSFAMPKPFHNCRKKICYFPNKYLISIAYGKYLHRVPKKWYTKLISIA